MFPEDLLFILNIGIKNEQILKKVKVRKNDKYTSTATMYKCIKSAHCTP